MARSRYVQIDGRLIEVFSDSTNSSIQELSEVVDGYADKLSTQPPPATLYHYTDASGFKGILESGTLWFTDIFSLNDTSELKHGVEVACQLLDKASSRADASPTCKEFAKTVSSVLLENVETSANYFVCCFTDNGDDLSQWKGYADDGRGYALGFDAVALEQTFAHSEVDHHSTFPVSYATTERVSSRHCAEGRRRHGPPADAAPIGSIVCERYPLFQLLQASRVQQRERVSILEGVSRRLARRQYEDEEEVGPTGAVL